MLCRLFYFPHETDDRGMTGFQPEPDLG